MNTAHRKIIQFPRLTIAALLLSSVVVVPEAHAIVGGSDSDESDNAVVKLIYQIDSETPGQFATCTGTIVAPNLILTAKHCVTESRSEGLICKGNGEAQQNGDNSGLFGDVFQADRFSILTGPNGEVESELRGKKILTSSSTSSCKDDVAFIILDGTVDIEPLPIRLNNSVESSEKIKAIGYGDTDVEDGTMRLQRSAVPILGVGPETIDTAEWYGIPIHSFQTESVACPGDSGGPAISEVTGAVLGVASIFFNSCFDNSGRATYSRLSPVKELVLQAYKEAGYPINDDGEVLRASKPDATYVGCDYTTHSANLSQRYQLQWLFAFSSLFFLILGRRLLDEKKTE